MPGGIDVESCHQNWRSVASGRPCASVGIEGRSLHHSHPPPPAVPRRSRGQAALDARDTFTPSRCLLDQAGIDGTFVARRRGLRARAARRCSMMSPNMHKVCANAGRATIIGGAGRSTRRGSAVRGRPKPARKPTLGGGIGAADSAARTARASMRRRSGERWSHALHAAGRARANGLRGVEHGVLLSQAQWARAADNDTSRGKPVHPDIYCRPGGRRRPSELMLRSGTMPRTRRRRARGAAAGSATSRTSAAGGRSSGIQMLSSRGRTGRRALIIRVR